MEAVESLIAEGFVPARTIYLAFGHDEELSGDGARQIVSILRSRGVVFEFVLDEGGAILSKVFPGLDKSMAYIGTAEKGSVNFELTCVDQGGHSSMPSSANPLSLLATAISRIQNSPMPARFTQPVRQMLQHLAPHLGLMTRFFVANMWLFEPVLLYTFAQKPSTNSAVRTTLAPTIFNAGIERNVLPTQASAVVNVRILPGDTVDSVLEHLRQAVNDPRISINTIGRFRGNPSGFSSIENHGYRLIKQTVQQVYPSVVVSPSLTTAATDSRYFEELTDPNSIAVYRFSPMHLESSDLPRLHGHNERIAIDSYLTSITFFRTLIRNAQK
eukprot:TRINITY_DN6343_c0_g1_i2.p1 TRINITY_DN6343_c0_g1~~TRINITY_DN6343_c0_g1_i2.p1  ORF type:complete len:329 (+),score=63.04 TRINITY_DN6343_c0_g1_i2:586-1572(+)